MNRLDPAWQQLATCAFLLASLGCAARTAGPRNASLRGIDTVVLAIPGTAGRITLVGASGMGAPGGSAGSDVELVRIAAETMRFELQKAGFMMTVDTLAADAIAEFTVGSVQFHPELGWVAQQALLRFRRPKSLVEVARFEASTAYAAPSIERMITDLAKSVRNARR